MPEFGCLFIMGAEIEGRIGQDDFTVVQFRKQLYEPFCFCSHHSQKVIPTAGGILPSETQLALQEY